MFLQVCKCFIMFGQPNDGPHFLTFTDTFPFVKPLELKLKVLPVHTFG